MYTDFFGLKEKPFGQEPSGRFIFLSESHQEGLATILYAVEEREGWALLLGDPGTGKTTMVVALLKELGDDVVTAVVTNPRMGGLDFYNRLALELGLQGPFQSKGQFLMAWEDLLERLSRENKTLAVIIDEAQDLPDELLVEFRLLGNSDHYQPRLLTMVLSGHVGLLRKLKKVGGKAMLQRFRRHYVLMPMELEETASYVRHRLRVSGGQPEIFTPEALTLVHRLSEGVPRVVNTLCDEAMLLAYGREASRVTPDLIQEAAKESLVVEWDPAFEIEPEPEPAPEPARPRPAPRPAEPAPPSEPLDHPDLGADSPWPRISNPQGRNQVEELLLDQDFTSSVDNSDTISLEGLSQGGGRARAAGGRGRSLAGLGKRLLVLLLLLVLAGAAWFGVKTYGKPLARRLGFMGPDLFMPQGTVTDQNQQNKAAAKLDKAPPEWGPSVTYPNTAAKESRNG